MIHPPCTKQTNIFCGHESTRIVSKYLKIVVALHCMIHTSPFLVVPAYKVRRETSTWQPLPASTAARSNGWWDNSNIRPPALAEEQEEYVKVKIDRTSANSRRIYGEIVAPVPLKDVWAILTDYDNLSVHVPNLVESRIVKTPESNRNSRRGDGSYRCRLYQRGAQKIIGFEFGASVTMEMEEHMGSSRNNMQSGQLNALEQDLKGLSFPNNQRRITFKCVDSFFFNEFDGEWKVVEQVGADGKIESLISYVVDVRPKGPVPVMALEWRIREDVPTNLRAVKKAAIEVGYRGVHGESVKLAKESVAPESKTSAPPKAKSRLHKFKVQWYEDETMAAYLKNP